MNKDIKFYQNNPCVIIRDVNEQFCEIQLNTHFAANIEASSYMTPSECRAPNSSFNEDEYESVQYLLEEIQEEEHSIICMVEKRLLHDKPVEISSINSLQIKIDDQNFEFESTKSLHEEWSRASKALKSQVEALKSEIQCLELSAEAHSNLRKTAKDGVNKLTLRYNKMMVTIDKYSIVDKQITRGQYDELNRRSCMLSALESGGVDNWEWYGESLKNAGLTED